MAKNNPTEQYVINADELDAKLSAVGSNRYAILGILGLEKYNTLTNRMSRGSGFNKQNVEALAEHLGCPVHSFAEPKESSPDKARSRKTSNIDDNHYFISAPEMHEKYRNFGSGDFVAVFSTDGFLEADNLEFYQDVIGAIDAGLEVFYIIPDHDGAKQSILDFDKLRTKFKKDINLPIQKRIHSHLIDHRIDIFGHSSRFVIFGKIDPDGEPETREVLLYVASLRDLWIRLPTKDHSQFLIKIQDSIDPVPYRPLAQISSEWALPSIVKNNYRVNFTGDEDGYGIVREVLGTTETANRVARLASLHLTDKEFDWETTALKWLDIGCENGSNTKTIYDTLKDGNEHQIALTAIDSSVHTSPLELLTQSVYWTATKGQVEGFLQRQTKSERFDLITSLHSWYVVDPLHIIEAYRRLTSEGIFVVATSPFREGPTPMDKEPTSGNFINVISGVADKHLRGVRSPGATIAPYDYKNIKEDPFRNYGEDIVTVFNSFFGKVGECWGFELIRRTIDSALIMDADGLTETGRLIAKFFTHGLPLADETAFFREVHERLWDFQKGDKLAADDFVLYVDKVELKKNYVGRPRFTRRRLRGRSLPPARLKGPNVVFCSIDGTCRDPMAKLLFDRFREPSDIEYVSHTASLLPGERPASWGARETVKNELGADLLAEFRSRVLDEALLEEADLVLVMEKSQLEDLRRVQVRHGSKIRLLSEFASEGLEEEISNPWEPDAAETEATLAKYRRCYHQLSDLLFDAKGRILSAAMEHRAARIA